MNAKQKLLEFINDQIKEEKGFTLFIEKDYLPALEMVAVPFENAKIKAEHINKTFNDELEKDGQVITHYCNFKKQEI